MHHAQGLHPHSPALAPPPCSKMLCAWPSPMLFFRAPAAAAQKELLAAAGKAQLEFLEQARRLYLKARAVTLAQRAKLYALDELDMATMRIRHAGRF